ncbi:hypothetical protein ERO13_D03G149900v2 [Gossypium hirsutum]|uniref:RING-type E3 ubiquitin transferase n=1 Tax=Gossypium hirsutum TaxID=3635 RepID=A0A1U8LND6_GOSHI|nr:probable E3 ubiquitin-protein ligase RHB1A [Gossypium hirsutum]KAG4156057.1 hypothetical protein ERO13_D03G149900v2 [Gossypium hirsutum]
MGGCCCCCSSGGVEMSSAPAYYYYPQASDEHVPLSYHNVAASALSTGLLVNTNLEVSVTDAYRPPPAPMPFDAVVEPPQTPSVIQGIHNSNSNETLQTTNVNCSQGTVAVNTLETSIKSENTKEDCKAQSNTDIESLKELEVDISKPVKSIVSTKEEEDVCPTCLEEYDAENPKIISKCKHHFHLACILEWMERSDTCPVCDKEMIFDLPTD